MENKVQFYNQLMINKYKLNQMLIMLLMIIFNIIKNKYKKIKLNKYKINNNIILLKNKYKNLN